MRLKRLYNAIESVSLDPAESALGERIAGLTALRSPRADAVRIEAMLKSSAHQGLTGAGWDPVWCCRPMLLPRRFQGILLEIVMEASMGNSQRRAIQNYRSRLSERGLARFEVLGRDSDRDLIRSLARSLAEDSAEASKLRAIVGQAVAGEQPKTGGVLAALRRSPLVDANLDLSRAHEEGRKVDL